MNVRAETSFLPAALEIQDRPPSPAGRATLWVIVVLFVSALAWASFGEVDVVAVAQGRIIPSGHSKTVQPLELGTVTAIRVAEGQAVEAGDVLIQLDPRAARADVARLQKEVDAADRAYRRVTRLADWLRRGDRPPLATAAEGSLLWAQWEAYRDQLVVLDRERERLQAEGAGVQRQIDKLKDVLAIVTRRAADEKALADRKLIPEQQYLSTEQERLTLYHDLGTQDARFEQLEAALREVSARARRLRSDFRREVLERREDADRRLISARQDLVKAQTRASAHTLRAPVDGVVEQLTVRNVGAVVTPAQELMVIVPRTRALEVEAVLENKDIGFVGPGQSAAVKVETFPFTKYGLIEGEILDLANDAVADERRGLVYKMRVRLKQYAMFVNGRAIPLSPGMNVTVEARTGKRRLIEYFLAPLLRYGSESVRER